jgi:hypothetical protein
MLKIKLHSIFLICITLTILAATSASAIPYCSTTESVNCAMYGIGGKDCHQVEDVVRGTECIDVSPHGMDIIESSRRQQQRPTTAEGCPPGFQPSENKCSTEERRHGCKDVRLSNGLGCVHR